jgi:tetratricopeptide (TPR) repeat protein
MVTGVILNLSYDPENQRALQRTTYYNLAAASLAEETPSALPSALHYVDEALSRAPSWPAAQLQRSSILHRLGIQRYKEGHLTDARELFLEAEAGLPELSGAGIELRHQARTLAADIRRSRALAAANAGAELLARGRLEEARSLLLESLELQPDSFEVHLNLGICELQAAREATLSRSREAALENSRLALQQALELARDPRSENRARALLDHLQGLGADPHEDPHQPLAPTGRNP